MINNRALKVLFTYNSLFLFSAMLLGPLYAIYVSKIGGGVLLISISTAVFYISSTIFLIFVSRWGDKVKEKEFLLVASYMLRGLGYLGFIFINSAIWLILIQALFGLADALGTPTFGALFSQHLDKKQEVLEYSDWSIVSNLVMAMGTVIGGYVASIFGFGCLFVLMAILCFAAGAGVLATPRRVL